MKRVRFIYEVKTVLRLSRQEIEELSQACEKHYDSGVRSLSIPGPGAVMNAFRNTLVENGEFAECPVSHRDLDGLCKATEQLGGERYTHITRLNNELARLLYESNSEHMRTNTCPHSVLIETMPPICDACGQVVDYEPKEG